MGNNRLALAVFLGLAVVVVTVILLSRGQTNKSIQLNAINSFEACAKQGYPIMESYPRQCSLPNGKFFVESTGSKECSGLDDCSMGQSCINHICQNLK